MLHPCLRAEQVPGPEVGKGTERAERASGTHGVSQGSVVRASLYLACFLSLRPERLLNPKYFHGNLSVDLLQSQMIVEVNT